MSTLHDGVRGRWTIGCRHDNVRLVVDHKKRVRVIDDLQSLADVMSKGERCDDGWHWRGWRTSSLTEMPSRYCLRMERRSPFSLESLSFSLSIAITSSSTCKAQNKGLRSIEWMHQEEKSHLIVTLEKVVEIIPLLDWLPILACCRGL